MRQSFRATLANDATDEALIPSARTGTYVSRRGSRLRVAVEAKEAEGGRDDDDDFWLTKEEIRALRAPIFDGMMRKARMPTDAYGCSLMLMLVTLLLIFVSLCAGAIIGYVITRSIDCGGEGQCQRPS